MSLPRIKQRWITYGLSALLIVLSLFAVLGERGLFHLWRLREEKREMEEKNYLLQKENEKLRERIHRLRHDNLYLEKTAREELGLVRPGEIVYRFASAQSKQRTAGRLSGPSSGSRRSSGQKARP